MQELCSSREGLLVVIPSVPAARQGDQLFLDDKAVSGLRLYSEYWPGRVRCIFREGRAAKILFGRLYDTISLPFEVTIVAEGAPIPDVIVRDAAAVLGSGDNHLDFSLAGQCRRLGIPLVFTIEYILETRLQIISLSETPWIKKLKSMVWTIKSELARRRAFVQADALQANGTPAAERYASLNREILTYFDTRLSNSMIASQSEVAEKAARRASGGPLRLAFSGRLERMKGADHLPILAERLMARGVDFRFDIFGVGSLASTMQEAIKRGGFSERVTIYDPLNFETGLVPWMCGEADLFVCCHRQSDPSSTYMETLGCGVPIVGYRNRAIDGIIEIADVGWLVQKDNIDALADKIAMLAAHREHDYREGSRRNSACR